MTSTEQKFYTALLTIEDKLVKIEEMIKNCEKELDEEEKKIRDRRAKQQRDSKMNRGGLTKKGNVDYRKTGMFYGGMVKKKK